MWDMDKRPWKAILISLGLTPVISLVVLVILARTGVRDEGIGNLVYRVVGVCFGLAPVLFLFLVFVWLAAIRLEKLGVTGAKQRRVLITWSIAACCLPAYWFGVGWSLVLIPWRAGESGYCVVCGNPATESVHYCASYGPEPFYLLSRGTTRGLSRPYCSLHAASAPEHIQQETVSGAGQYNVSYDDVVRLGLEDGILVTSCFLALEGLICWLSLRRSRVAMACILVVMSGIVLASAVLGRQHNAWCGRPIAK